MDDPKMSRRRSKAFPLGAFIKDVLERHPSFSSNPLGDWSELVGEPVARNTMPLSLKNGRLVIVARDSVWKHHLEMNKEALRQRINARWEKHVVEEIRIRVGELEEVESKIGVNHERLQKVKAKRVRRRKPPIRLRPLTDEEKELIRRLPDPDLRKMGKRLLQLLPEDAES